MEQNMFAHFKTLDVELEKITPKFPIQALRLLNAYQFSLKIVGLNASHEEIYKKIFESDSFGNFNFKIPLIAERKDIQILQVYETSRRPGLELLMGTYIPIVIPAPKKIVICDFDKTLVDTKYSTTKELYRSLTSPIERFPTVPKSVEILKSYISAGHHPFILSASPHFYEDSMRDWLYKNNIFSAGIFLKDYRHFFSFLEGNLTTKDLRHQGLYKLNHLLDILLMTGIPDELVLMGDNYESDPAIYLTLANILREDVDPWGLWNDIKEKDIFQIRNKQNSHFLNKIYQLDNLLTRERKKFPNKKVHIEIYIRKRFDADEINLNDDYIQKKNLSFLIQLYDGQNQKDDSNVVGANNTKYPTEK
jgi:hypothetical protein